VWDPQVFALALAKAVGTKDATDADIMLRALVCATCRRRHVSDDAGDVLQSTWNVILHKARDHQTAPSIAKQVPTIVDREAANVVRARIHSRAIVVRLDRYLKDVGTLAMDDLPDEAATIDEVFDTIMARLRDEHDRQYAAIALTLESADQEEARRKYEHLYNTTISPEHFRQLHSRGKKHLRRYREQSDD